MTREGLSHSEISGSKSVCGSPEHIAAYHVLHRLLTPSHPPQTLRSLTLCHFLEPTYIGFLKMFRLTLYEIVKERPAIKTSAGRPPMFLWRTKKIFQMDLSGVEPLTS